MSLNFAFCRALYISVSRLRAIMLCPNTDTLIYINVFEFCRVLYISLCQLRAIMLCPITDKPIYINVFEFCILQRIIYIGESATCHNVMCRLDPHKTSMLSMLNSARLFSLQPATSLSSRPPLPSTPRGTAQLETPERQSLTTLERWCKIKMLTPTRTQPLVSVPSSCTMPCDLCLLCGTPHKYFE